MDYGECCWCGSECNPASQDCGRCVGEALEFMRGGFSKEYAEVIRADNPILDALLGPVAPPVQPEPPETSAKKRKTNPKKQISKYKTSGKASPRTKNRKDGKREYDKPT
jgi:hypothetical protein